MNQQKVKFKEWNCITEHTPYAVDSKLIRILLRDIEDLTPIAVATSYIEGLKEGEVAVKNYSENQGMLQALVEYDIVEKPHRMINEFPICYIKTIPQ